MGIYYRGRRSADKHRLFVPLRSWAHTHQHQASAGSPLDAQTSSLCTSPIRALTLRWASFVSLSTSFTAGSSVSPVLLALRWSQVTEGMNELKKCEFV